MSIIEQAIAVQINKIPHYIMMNAVRDETKNQKKEKKEKDLITPQIMAMLEKMAKNELKDIKKTIETTISI